MTALKITNLYKKFGTLQAVDNLNLSVNKGDFYALLGPNGAGKSTLINMVSTLLVQDEGNIEIFGHDTLSHDFEAKQHLGIVPQEFNFGIFDKVIDIILNQAGYYGIRPQSVKERAYELLKSLELFEKKDVQARFLSGGMKRRLMIARALIHSPKILILDEPTAGVDIEIRRNIWDFLTQINQSGITIILTTHYLEEAEVLCNKVGIINNGRLLKQGSVRQLIDAMDQQTFVCDISDSVTAEQFFDAPFNSTNLKDEHTVEISLKQPLGLTDIFKYFEEKQLLLTNIRPKNNRLEDMFLKITSQGESQ